MGRPWALGVLLMVGTAPLFRSLKLVPALVCCSLLLLPNLAPRRVKKHVLWLVLVLWGSVIASTLAYLVAVTLFPARSGEHPVMPIGQVLVAAPIGVLTSWWVVGRATPTDAKEVEQLAALLVYAWATLLPFALVFAD